MMILKNWKLMLAMGIIQAMFFWCKQELWARQRKDEDRQRQEHRSRPRPFD